MKGGNEVEYRAIPDSLKGIMTRSIIQIVRRPLMWIALFGLPLFMFLFVGSILDKLSLIHISEPTRP